MRAVLACVLALTLSSCYRCGGLYEDYAGPGVRVRIFDNISQRRTHEFDLTNAVVHELSSRGIRVNVPDARYVLEGRILEIRTPPLVEGETDQVLIGSLRFAVEIRLIDRRAPEGTDPERWRDLRSESVSFTTARGESFDSARAEVFDRLARWAATHFEKGW